MWACAACFIPELHAVDFGLWKFEFFEPFHAHFGHEVTEVYVAQGNVTVFVEGGGTEEIRWEIFGEAFGQDDDAEFLVAGTACGDEFDDVVDEDADIEVSVVRFTGIFHHKGNIFDADDHLGFAGHGYAIGEPSGLSAHTFGDEVGAGGAGVGFEIADFLCHEVDGGEVTERKIDAVVVVVDRLGQVHDANAFFDLGVVLPFVEFVGRFERVVTADGDERIDAEATQTEIRLFERFGFGGIVEIGGTLNQLSGIGEPCRS